MLIPLAAVTSAVRSCIRNVNRLSTRASLPEGPSLADFIGSSGCLVNYSSYKRVIFRIKVTYTSSIVSGNILKPVYWVYTA